MLNNLSLSWADRLALIDHFKPSDEEACKLFEVTVDELNTARSLQKMQTIGVTTQLDYDKYAGFFGKTTSQANAESWPASFISKKIINEPTSHVKPETATKKLRIPQKRGRKGNKIEQVLQQVPVEPVSVEAFIKQHNVSLPVLRQAKRFISKFDPVVQEKIGVVVVRQDKTTKQLMIWRKQN